MPDRPLDQDEILAILAGGRGRGPRADPTEPRETMVWFRANTIIREEGCDNPDCVDPRIKSDKGTNIVLEVRGKYMCRFCFLGGWLSNAKTETADTSSTGD